MCEWLQSLQKEEREMWSNFDFMWSSLRNMARNWVFCGAVWEICHTIWVFCGEIWEKCEAISILCEAVWEIWHPIEISVEKLEGNVKQFRFHVEQFEKYGTQLRCSVKKLEINLNQFRFYVKNLRSMEENWDVLWRDLRNMCRNFVFNVKEAEKYGRERVGQFWTSVVGRKFFNISKCV